MKKPFLLLFVLLALGLLSQPLYASSYMRCSDRIIKKNDHISKIERFCRAPDSYISDTGYKTVSRYSRLYRSYFYEEVPVLYEEMLFNFGPNKFMRLVKLENGRVVHVETLGYGYIDKS
ncbi:MAG: DUF2845 domain-containing protein [Gammaproteobacteria bacterium]|nr:DUF2845 domain-containing protein [Gammaproteobacteria bacterium]NNC98030.1 DUF2845 domain-containing protein [Gammaproteobacteria bacterium]NNM12736.1 DUF2845 domain-containing protein [Gammaproteobacteria bacterium]